MEQKPATLLKQRFQQDSQLRKIITIFILIEMRWFKNKNSHKKVYYLGKISKKYKHNYIKPRNIITETCSRCSVSHVSFSFTNSGSCFHFSLNSYQLNINKHEFMQRKWYLKYHMFINLISSTKHEEQVQEFKKHTLLARKYEMLQKFQQRRILEKKK